jgi:hypothetical protein
MNHIWAVRIISRQRSFLLSINTGYSKIAWPGEFDEEVLSTFGMLKKRHSILIGKISAGITPLHFFKKNQA